MTQGLQPISGRSRATTIIVTIAVLVAAIGVIGYFLHVQGTGTTTHTTVTVSPPAPNTTTAPVTTTTPRNTSFAPADILKPAYALYGLPNASRFNNYGVGPSGSLTESFFVGATGGNIAEYGLNFTYLLVGSPTEPALNYSMPVPAQYSNASYPVGVIIQTFNFSSNSDAAHFFSIFQYNNTLNDTVNRSVNSSVQGYVSEANFSVVRSIPANSSKARWYKTMLTADHTVLDGVPVSVLSFSPIYQRMVQYQLAFRNNSTVIIVITFGVAHSFDSSYSTTIATNMIKALRALS